MKLYCLIFIMAACQLSSAGQDSAFIKNYTDFRTAIDSFKTYSLYIDDPNSERKLSLINYKTVFEQSFHFLRALELKNKKADCLVLLAVKDLSIIRPPERSSTHGQDMTFHQIKTYYRLSFDIELYRNNVRIFSFPIMSDSLLYKIYRYRIRDAKAAEMESFAKGKTNDFIQPAEHSMTTDPRKTEPTVEDIRNHLIALIRMYKNYYIDRVDWKHSK